MTHYSTMFIQSMCEQSKSFIMIMLLIIMTMFWWGFFTIFLIIFNILSRILSHSFKNFRYSISSYWDCLLCLMWLIAVQMVLLCLITNFRSPFLHKFSQTPVWHCTRSTPGNESSSLAGVHSWHLFPELIHVSLATTYSSKTNLF